jgi:hypothetical protein
VVWVDSVPDTPFRIRHHTHFTCQVSKACHALRRKAEILTASAVTNNATLLSLGLRLPLPNDHSSVEP